MNLRTLVFVAVALSVACTDAMAAQPIRVTLETRKQNEYGQSGYSFRYRTTEKSKHRNNVDVTFENGVMRVNHHGGLQSRIADLGDVELASAAKAPKNAKWETRNIRPVQGHTYVLQLQIDGYALQAAFKIDKLYDDELQFLWIPGKRIFPVPVTARGMAGTSGFRPAAASVQPYRSSSNSK